MPERNLDFDRVIDRRGTDCLKFDFAKRRGMPEDLMSFWVADMDFQTSSYIQDALRAAVDHGIFGYSDPTERYYAAVKRWMKTRHDYDVEEEETVAVPGVVFGLSQAVRAFTSPGDAVAILQPVYYPFSEVVLSSGRKLVVSELVRDASGRYAIDYEDFERKLDENDVKLFINCSPHNPVGRVWTREELERLGDLCLSRNVLFVSDEIHNDFDFSGKHVVFSTIKRDYVENSIVCTSPSKTFNLAGLQTGNFFIPNPKLRRKFRATIESVGYSQMNLMGIVATIAAYEHGDEWRDAMMKYVEGNIDFAVEFINGEIPGVSTLKNEGTYLMWLDFSEFGLVGAELDRFIVDEAKLWLDGGGIFGASGRNFQRVNVACSREYLTRGLERLRSAVLARR